MDETELDRWWERFTARLRDEAERRGGTAYTHDWAVNLAPPGGVGAYLHVTRSDDGYATVETGFVAKAMGSYVEFEDASHSALSLVLAVLDGTVREFADAEPSGRWVDVRSYFPLPDGSSGRAQPRDRAGEVAVRTFERTIPGWGQPPAGAATSTPRAEPPVSIQEVGAEGAAGIRFLSLEEAVRQGVTDEDGNFLD